MTFKDFVVYYNMKSQAYSIVDLNHKKFPSNIRSDQSDTVVRRNQIVDGTDFHLIECRVNKTSQSYFVLYPAPYHR